MKETESDFQKAIEFSMLWCKAWEEGELSDEVLADKVSELTNSLNGVRGFLAFCLSSDCPLLDRLPEPLVIQLRASGEIVIDITVKNLAMSTAMAIHHQRNSDRKTQKVSERITERCSELLRLLEPNAVKRRLEKLIDGIEGKGADVIFLKKWGYDQEQKQAIRSSINNVAEKK